MTISLKKIPEVLRFQLWIWLRSRISTHVGIQSTPIPDPGWIQIHPWIRICQLTQWMVFLLWMKSHCLASWLNIWDVHLQKKSGFQHGSRSGDSNSGSLGYDSGSGSGSPKKWNRKTSNLYPSNCGSKVGAGIFWSPSLYKVYLALIFWQAT